MKQNFRSVVKEVKNKVDIVRVIGKYVQLHHKGDRYVGLSPFKNEHTPSFYVDPEKKLYYCFSTSQGGDVIRFIETIEHVDFFGAIKILAESLGISMERSYTHDDYGALSNKNDRILELCARINKTFSYLFWQKENEHAYRYMSERGISDEILRSFHIGYAPRPTEWLYSFLQGKGYSPDEIIESGLFSIRYKKYSLFRNRIMFPIFTVSGQAIAYGGRLLDGEGPKYINSPETRFYKKKHNLFGLYQCVQSEGFRKMKKAYLVEGYLDVMALHQVGITSALAPLGTAFTREQAEVVRTRTDTIVLLFDNDEAGIQASLKSAVICESVGFRSILVVELSENDPADVLQKYGASELRTQILEELDFYDYYINKVFPGVHANVADREQAIHKIVSYVASVQSPYKQSMYISAIADLFQVSTEVINKNIEQSHEETSRSHQNIPPSAQQGENDNDLTSGYKIDYKKHPIKTTREMIVLATLCGTLDQDVQYLNLFRNNIKVSDMQSIHAKHIYTIIEEQYRKTYISFSDIMNAMDEPLAHYLQSLLSTGEAGKNTNAVLQEYFIYIKVMRLKKRGKDIEYQLRTYNNPAVLLGKKSFVNDGEQLDATNHFEHTHELKEEKMKELLMEKQFINKEIARLSSKSE